jgi:hypothetical protein
LQDYILNGRPETGSKEVFIRLQAPYTAIKSAVTIGETYLRDLVRFDKYCARHFPDASELTQEIVHSWYNEETISSRYLLGKATAIRQFGKYLNAVNEEAYRRWGCDD